MFQMTFLLQSVRWPLQANKLQDHCEEPFFSNIVAGLLNSHHIITITIYVSVFQYTYCQCRISLSLFQQLSVGGVRL